MSAERDELAAVVYQARWVDGIRDAELVTDEKLSEAILAAGYRKPRMVTTVEELDALPDGVIIMDGRGSCREGLRTMGGGNVWRAMGPAKVLRSKEVALPATVLHEGSGA